MLLIKLTSFSPLLPCIITPNVLPLALKSIMKAGRYDWPIPIASLFIIVGWAESRKRVIRCTENRSLEMISQKSSPRNFDLRFLSINNFSNKRACCLGFDCLQGTVCSSLKNYFERSNHNAKTRNNGKHYNFPRSNLISRARSFYFV